MVLEIEEVSTFPASTLDRLLDKGRRQAEAASQDRSSWVARCARRLHELRPKADTHTLDSLADSMWLEVSSFDPTLAAEMEHECWE
ncbi:MAG TPA: hypothetical protein VKI18_14725 [Albitalea sp.]|nr:hypothetical protein [Albitalea sp.]